MKVSKHPVKLVFSFLMLLCSLQAGAQNSREYIRNAINEWGECKNVAITKTNGDIALYGRNGSARSGIPVALDNAIVQLHSQGELIDDIQLTEAGNWLILYGDNGLQWSGIPYNFEAKLREFNEKGEVITSVSFNDSGDWIVISQNLYSTSNTQVRNLISENIEKYGTLWGGYFSDSGFVGVFAKGYVYYGSVPEGLKQALRETSLDIYRAKMAGNSWFIADTNGSYQYSM